MNLPATSSGPSLSQVVIKDQTGKMHMTALSHSEVVDIVQGPGVLVLTLSSLCPLYLGCSNPNSFCGSVFLALSTVPFWGGQGFNWECPG